MKNDSILKDIRNGATSLRTIFFRPDTVSGQMIPDDSANSVFLNALFSLFSMLESELEDESDVKDAGRRMLQAVGIAPDSADWFNAVSEICGDMAVHQMLQRELALRLASYKSVHPSGNSAIELEKFWELHAVRLMNQGLRAISEYFRMAMAASSSEDAVSRFNPCLERLFAVPDAESMRRLFELKEIEVHTAQCDLLCSENVLKHSGGRFLRTHLGHIRKVEDFYGYRNARELFLKYFMQFSQNGENLPLLISSLPGLGKTHFTISHTLHFQNLSLILCEPAALEQPLAGIIADLAERKDRRYVLFFDDVDTRKIDWYHFRTNVGGAYVLPSNICLVIASNYDFPANILSRGRGFTFPVFNDIMCQEMITDFVRSLGMKNPRSELSSVIAADYLEEFGQHMFEELSPRTLSRYLEKYSNDAGRRKKMLDLSFQKVIPLPDPGAFVDTNQKIIERLKESI